MGAFFESALLFSLAVLIILVGLLIYYFKGRISDVEQKNLKCFEIINDVYKSHLELKFMIQNAQVETPKMKDDQRIKIEIQECSEDSCSDSDDSCSDSDSDSDSDNNFNDDQIKMVNIDFSNEIEIEVEDINENIDEDIDENIDENIDEDMDEDMEVEVEDMDEDIEVEVEEVESAKIIVSKLEIEGDIDLSVAHSTNNDRESYKKMNISALRGFIISNGYQTDSAKLQKMKKNELIDLIIEH
jgi:hypothetical protein